jgi:cytochrome c peroxidase
MTLVCRISIGLLNLSLLFTVACRRSVNELPIGPPVNIAVPLGLPPLPIPSDNPPTAQAIALGRKLFYDKRLSVDSSIACSSCHDPRYDFTDGSSLSRGVAGAIGVRNAPTILNAAYLPLQFWDGRAISLEQQAASPIFEPREMHQARTTALPRLGDDPVYQLLFKQTFGTSEVTVGRVEKALASFERTVLSGNSAFDRYQYSGDKSALTPQQVQGLAVFIDPNRGNCAACHSLNPASALFTDGKFHNTGEGAGDAGQFFDTGRFHETKVETDTGAFKTPTLRNVANTAPYMHDGKLRTLKDVVDFYAGGGNSNPYLDPDMKKIHLTAQERVALVEFLKSLTGELPRDTGPP